MAVDLTASAAACVSAGVSACVVAMIGVEPQALFWGFLGASLGLTYAAQAGRARAALVFAAVVCGAALGGTVAAERCCANGHLWRDFIALVLGAVAHPLLSAFITQLPQLARGWAKRLGASNDAS